MFKRNNKFDIDTGQLDQENRNTFNSGKYRSIGPDLDSRPNRDSLRCAYCGSIPDIARAP
ncbi:MAG: hypothetical protein IH867_00570 [Chloroflexi bacterium]|nr:hypothetical protein [Chloroflexota bacterium]